ncbi:WbqC family protein [Pseudodesulfovibrio methanolicus]|uniref:WbqC family protein n=1 Tax=Pseudodesulfovibrio methanolicus TaxID=3126690 RepID=A0ABZ2IX16_9BACT
MIVVSGHQPAYLPWLGLLHKASLCDVFVYMDDVQFLTRDFNHRNRVVTPSGQVLWLTVPVDRKGSPSDRLADIRIGRSQDRKGWQEEHSLTLRSCYGKAPYFKEYWPFFEWLYHDSEWTRLADLNLAMLKQAFDWFGLSPRIEIGSECGFTGRKSDLVLEHAETFGAEVVVTGAMGRDYIRIEDFEGKGIKVIFQEYNHPEYSQGRHAFASPMAFVDLLFRHGPQSAEIAFGQNMIKDELL